MKTVVSSLFLGITLTLWVAALVFGDTAGPVPMPGMVTMLELGADKCIPCKMMAPIIAELKTEYAGIATIAFIDVWKNPDAAKKYGIRAIPTQIFFDQDGREVERHTGFMDKVRIVDMFTKLGAAKEKKADLARGRQVQ